MKKLPGKSLSKYQAYTIEDIVEIFGISERSVYRWMDKGLTPLEPNTKPLYFMGDVINNFVVQSKKRKKYSMKKHQFWCMKCREPVSAKPKSIEIIKGRRYGACNKCDTKINRYTSKTSVSERAP